MDIYDDRYRVGCGSHGSGPERSDGIGGNGAPKRPGDLSAGGGPAAPDGEDRVSGSVVSVGRVSYCDDSQVALFAGGDDEETVVAGETYLYSFRRRVRSGLCLGLFDVARDKCTVDVVYASVLAVLCLIILFVLILDR